MGNDRKVRKIIFKQGLGCPTPKWLINMFKQNAKWYVYELYDSSGNIAYIGKGTGHRLSQSKRAKKLDGDKIAIFWDEDSAFSHEKERIALYNPKLNKNLGGFGGKTSKIKSEKQLIAEEKIFYKECDIYGTRWMAAKILMRYIGYFPKNRAENISKVYFYGLKTTEVCSNG